MVIARRCGFATSSDYSLVSRASYFSHHYLNAKGLAVSHRVSDGNIDF
jgi:hypothetical protein